MAYVYKNQHLQLYKTKVVDIHKKKVVKKTTINNPTHFHFTTFIKAFKKIKNR